MWWRRPAPRPDVIVNLKHDPDTAIRGVLVASDAVYLTLRNVQLLSPKGATRLDGEVWVQRRDVAFIQRPIAPEM